MNLTELSASDIGQVVSIESKGSIPWYVEGVLYRLNAEQERISCYTLLGVEDEELGDVNYNVNIGGWERHFSAHEASETIVSIVNKVD